MTTIHTEDTLKMVRETLCVAQSAISFTFAEDPRLGHHIDHLQHLIDDIDRQRPLGPDGKHGELRTETCGCDLS